MEITHTHEYDTVNQNSSEFWLISKQAYLLLQMMEENKLQIKKKPWFGFELSLCLVSEDKTEPPI